MCIRDRNYTILAGSADNVEAVSVSNDNETVYVGTNDRSGGGALSVLNISSNTLLRNYTTSTTVSLISNNIQALSYGTILLGTDSGAQYLNETNITVVGSLDVNLHEPTAEKRVVRNEFFEFTVNVTCVNGSCPDTTVTGFFMNGTGNYTEEWNNTYGGNDADDGYSIQQTSDGGYILTGRRNYYGYKLGLIKLDENGTQQWETLYGLNDSQSRYGYSVKQTTDDGYVVAGKSNYNSSGLYDLLILKTSSDGTVDWAKKFGGSGEDYAESVIQTSDGGYLIVGSTESFGEGLYDIWIIKTNSTGDQEWNKTYGGNESDYGYGVIQHGNNYVIGGITESLGAGNQDAWIIKINSTGGEIWNYTYGLSNNEGFYSLIKIEDGYVGAGFRYLNATYDEDVWILKTNFNGTEQWNKSHGGTAKDNAESIVETADEGFLMTGWTNSVSYTHLTLPTN